MSSASFFEQLTGSVSLSMLAIASASILALLLVYNIACRLFYTSTAAAVISSKQQPPKSKKTKTATIKKQQVEPKAVVKGKKNALAASSSTSSSSSQSDESDDEKATVVQSSKKLTTPIKVVPEKKATTIVENKKVISTSNGTKAPGRAEKSSGLPMAANKTKQTNNNVASAPGKAEAASKKAPTSGGKGDTSTPKQATNTQKKQSAVVDTDVKAMPMVDEDAGSDRDDEGQWVTQSTKQVSSRLRTKGKVEAPQSNKQDSPKALPNRNVRLTSNAKTSSAIVRSDSDIEATMVSGAPALSPPNQEPIEIFQLLSANEDRYTHNDTWWKQALNVHGKFSVEEIGEWPEREQDEEFIVQVKRIVPVRNNNPPLNEEQDIDQQFNSHEPANRSSVSTADSKVATAHEPTKKASNVRRIS